MRSITGAGELLMTIGYYGLVSRVLENVEVDIEDHDPLQGTEFRRG